MMWYIICATKPACLIYHKLKNLNYLHKINERNGADTVV